MTFKVRINVDVIENMTYSGSTIYCMFEDIPEDSYVDCTEQETDIVELYLNSDSSKEIDFSNSGGGGTSWTSHFTNLSTNGNYFEFVGTLASSKEDLAKFVELGVIEITPINNDILVYLYTINSENNALSKTLKFVNLIVGKFNSAFSLKNPILDFHFVHFLKTED